MAKIIYETNKDEILLQTMDAIELAERTRLSEERLRMQEAEEKGLAQGLEKGMKQGLEQGLEQGQLKLINSMLSNGISLEQISKMTNLSLEELNKLINK